jgi:uncharacterized membrane protein
MELLTVVAALGLGLVLSISAGLRAFIAPFCMSAAAALGLVDLGDALAWMASPLAVGTFGFAIAFELLADKVPAVDHAMDTVHFLAKPAAGALVAMAMMDGADPVLAAVASLATGGVVAGATHAVKATVRLGSTCTTVGTCNPVLSVAEDVVAVVLSLGATAGVAALAG